MSEDVRPPFPVRLASVLWIILGSVLSLGACGAFANPQLVGSGSRGYSVLVVLLVVGAGVVFVVLGVQLRRGRDYARITLTVLGGMSMCAIWPILLALPAIIAQFQSASNAWFKRMDRG